MAWIRCTGNTGGSLKVRTASGRIATFETNIADVLRSVKCEINAKQDLHGYDHPWSAGSGKNKLDESTVYSVLEDSGEYHVKQGGTQVYNIKFYIPSALVGMELTYSAKFKGVNGANYRVIANVAGTNKNGNLINTADYSLSQVTFTPTSTADYISIDYGTGADSGGVGMFKDCQLEISSTATNYEPYSNICPINGYSSVNITRYGVNLWDETWDNCYWNENANGVKVQNASLFGCNDYIPVCEGTNIRFVSPTVNPKWYVLWYDKNKDMLSYTRADGGDILTVPANAYYMTFYNNNTAYSPTYNNDISINYPATDTAYHAYNGQTYAIAFGQTVYGGVLHIKNGRTWFEVKFLEFDLGILTPVMYVVTEGNLFRYALDDLEPLTSDYDVTKIICSNYPSVASASRANKTLSQVSNLLRFDIIDNDYNDAASMKTAMNGVEVAYPLETPFDIDLTPVQVEQLLGKNNVWHDANGNTEVKFLEVVRS